MARYMMQFQRPGSPPTLGDIKAEYGLNDNEVDPAFGVVLIDPRDSTYAIRVDEKAVEKLKPGGAPESMEAGPLTYGRGGKMKGPYSDPRIEPTGPPRPGGKGAESKKR